MISRNEKEHARAVAGDRSGRRREISLVLTILLGLAATAGLARWIEAHPKPESVRLETEELYVTPEAAKRMSLGFNGLVADWYWMRTLQYVGRKVLAHRDTLQLDDLSPLGLKQLAPLLEQATTLDQQFMAAYEYGAMVLPAVDVEAAIKLINRGIAANPQAWQLYHHLGYIYWQHGRFREASEAYATGSLIQGAPPWMKAMAAQMEAHGGSREVAREIYRRMYAEADDEQVKEMARRRLLQVDSLDERDVIRRVLAYYRTRAGRCPGAWREVAALLRAARLRVDASGAPLDPSDTPYVLDPVGCDVNLDLRSVIPQK